MTLTAAALASLCACGVDKPDLESVSDQTNSTEASSAATTEKKKLTRQDSYILGEMADKFQVEAEILNEKTSLPSCYYLSRINMSADQIAERLLSDTGYSRDDIGHGIVAFSNGNEKLVLDPDGRSTGPFFPSPNLTYALDKGKEYEAVVKYANINEISESPEAKKAVALVKEKLNKLPVEYDNDLKVEEFTPDDLNTYYSWHLDIDSREDIPDSNDISEEEMVPHYILLYCDSKDLKFDKDFKFSEDDSCFLVKGNMKVNDVQISTLDFLSSSYSITAAVSSRGIEYLYVEDLYIPDNGSSESPMISPEQAIEAFYTGYADSQYKDNYEVKIDKICLNYIKEDTSDGQKIDASNVKLRPAWTLSMNLINREMGDGQPCEASVYADNAEVITPFSEIESAFYSYTRASDAEEKGG